MTEKIIRQISLDTETTGMDAAGGDRLIEIGCVELINRNITGSVFHTRLNPEREVDPGAAAVHGMTWDVLKKEPLFKDKADEFLDFIKGAQLLIHNASFDVGFLNAELSRLDRGRLEDYCDSIVDTLKLAQSLRPGQRNNLDTLCTAYGVDLSLRTKHGADIDARLLAEVYLRMTRGQDTLDIRASDAVSMPDFPDVSPLRVVLADKKELEAHRKTLDLIDTKLSKGKLVWKDGQGLLN